MKERGLRSSCVPGGCWGCLTSTTKEAPDGRVRRAAVRGYRSAPSAHGDRADHRVLVRCWRRCGSSTTWTRLDRVMARAGEDPEVVLEATYGWYWAVDALQAAGARVHLAHPLGVKAFEYRRVKNDVRDATDLADLLRMGRLPEAWIAPPATRELRELVRHRAKLVGLRSRCKAEIHAVLAKCGVQVLMSDLFGVAGTELLERVATCRRPYAARVRSLRRLIEDLEVEIDLFAGWSAGGWSPTPATSRSSRSRDRPDPGRGVRRRGRRRHPVRQRRAAGLLGRADAQAPRVRHPRAPGPDHQAGLPAGPVGGGRVGPAARPHTGSARPRPGRGPPGPQHRRRRRRPRNRSSTSTTRCATTTSAPSHPPPGGGMSPPDPRPVAGRAGHDPRRHLRRGRAF